MAQIDVTDLVLDPDFVDPVMVIRRGSMISAYGENIITENPLHTVASVQPASGKQLERIPESLRIHDVRCFYIKMEIIQDSTCEYPDILVFRGVRYQVQSTMNWEPFGRGWNEAIATRERIS